MNLATIAEGHPAGAVALVSRGHPITYGRLQTAVAGVRAGLAERGLEPGDRVGIVCANNPSFVLAYLGVLGAGLVAVPLNPTSPAAELSSELAAVGARAVVAGQVGITAVPQLEHVIDGPALHEMSRSGADAVIVDRAESDLAVLVFTAGTAGSPKAAMLTHANLVANIRQVQAVPARTLQRDDVVLGVLPLFHSFGLNAMLGVALAAGGSVVLVERFDPASALATIATHGCTVVPGAPPMWVAWGNMADADPAAMRTVRIAISGADRLPIEAYEAVRARFGVEVQEGYGLTEASPVVTTAFAGPAAPGSIGRPLPGVEIRLVDDDGDDVPLGDPGEIWVRGPNVFAGYWDDPAATALALTDEGWLRTGDVGVVGDDGNLRIVDRQKDLIIVSGFNVFPAEVEAVLADHPDVVDVVVAGVDHPHTGEAVKAWVVLRPDASVEEDGLIAHCAGRLAGYKCPTKFLFLDEIPRTPAGKVKRRELR